MEYVGKLGSLITTVHNFYNEINPATLSGAIDIVVVEQEDGDLACSPFHVRFGKLSVLMPQEKRVQIKVNDQVVPYVMKVGEAGEAFFVFETDYEVPEEFQTSPIMEAVPEVNQEGGGEGEEPPFLDIGESKDQKEKKNDDDDDNDNKTDNFDDEDEQKQQENESSDHKNNKVPNKIPAELQSPKMIIDEQMDKVVTKMDPYHKKPGMDHDHNHHHGSDSDGEVNSAIDTLKDTADELTLEDRPKNDVYKMDDGSTLLERVIPEAITTTTVAKERFVVRPASGDIYSTFMDVTHTSVHKEDDEKEGRGEESIVLDIAGYKTGSGGDDGDENWDESEEAILKEAELIDGVLQTNSDEKKLHEIDHQKSVAEQILEKQQQIEAQKPRSKNELPSSSSAAAAAAAPTTNWGWGETRKQQENENKDKEEKDRNEIFNSEDAQVKSVELQPGQTYRIELSLCGFSAFGEDEDENARLFEESQITYDKFTHNPNILNDRRLVFRYQGRYYAASHTGPLLTSLLLFKKPLEDVSRADSDSEDDMADSRESYQFGKGWRQWLSRSSVAAPTHNEGHQNEDPAAKENQETTTFTTTTTTTSVGWTADHVHPHGDDDTGSNEDPFPVPRKVYAKTLRLTSDQLKSLHLKKGVNDISFSVSSAYQGTATCAAKIFFWDYDIQIVISDIDGTITKSDTLGHVFTMIGKDWTHLGVANLYTDIANNGYHMLYLTSRAIGQADYTRDYLKKIEQGNYQLPDGPVIMSPDRLFTSLHREVIMRKPEVFKMACLKDIQRLFGGRDPFYAGFGNRITDARSYRSVNVPTSRIFTIDPYGDLKLELLLGFKSSYIHLNDLVDQIFPPINRAIDEEYNDWNYWKSPVPEIDIPELDEPLEPTSPKPKPIKPDPSSLPDYAVVEASQNKSRGAGGLLRSFTSRSSNNININTTNNTMDNNKKKFATIQPSHSTPTVTSSSGSSSNNYSSSSLNINTNNKDSDSDSELSGKSIPMEHSMSETTLLKNSDNSSTSKNSNNNGGGGGGGIMNKMIRTFLSSDNNANNKNEAKTEENKSEKKKEDEEENENEEEVDNNDQELDDIMDDIDMNNIPFI